MTPPPASTSDTGAARSAPADSQRRPTSWRKLAVPATVAAVALVVALATALSSGDDSPAASAVDDVPAAPADPMSLGSPDAKVVMLEFSDFQCPFCGRYARETAPELIQRYVDAGVLRIEWRDFPYLGDESWYAARAARAAGNQGKFWEFHDALFADDTRRPNTGAITPELVAGIAADIGLDVDRFRADVLSDAVLADVRADFEDGMVRGVNGTPAFFVNGFPIYGAQPDEVFVEAIERAAAAR